MSIESGTPSPGPPVHAPRVPAPPAPVRAPAGAEPATDTGVPASAYGWLAEGGFAARLGSGLRLGADLLAARELDPARIPQPLPGVRITGLRVRERQVHLTGSLLVPHLDANEVRIRLDRDGTAHFSAHGQTRLQVPALGNPRVRIGLDEAGRLSGTLEFRDLDLSPPRTELEATGSGTLALANGRFSGQVHADLVYPRAGSAALDVGFDENGAFTGSGTLTLALPFLDAVGATITADAAGNLAAAATIDATGAHSPLPGLSVGTGQVVLGFGNGRPTATLSGFSASYSGVGSLSITTLELGGRNPGFSGAGELVLTIPGLEEVTGRVAVTNSRVSGTLRIDANKFPEGLPLTNGSLTIILSESGQLGFRGSVGVALEPAARGRLEASYEEGRFALSTQLELTIPGMAPVQVTVAYLDGAISGAVDVPIDSETLPGLSGAIHVEYAQDRWSGETTLAYSADDGKLSGTVTVTVTQTEDNSLQVGGSGSVTAQLLPNLAGTLTATILPEGGVDVSGTIEVTEPVELFGEKRVEKELFSHSQNIPLWAILVAVIRIRAGVRAGIGPGVFRNITVTGSYTIGATEADPSFTVSGELFIPAFVEGYLAFGAGLGLDVVLGSLTGGIEAMGTAGIYGAISVIPELSYEGGQWSIAGVATLAAGARLKLSLNAWAEVEALWVTVWDNTWELASVTMPIGPDLALQARMNYVFGRPEPPELEFSSTDIDSESLIQSAMPEDGPEPSGAREALENKAEWQGALREARTAPVPAELAAQASHTEPAPQPARRPPAPGGPRPGAARADAPGHLGEPTATPAAPGTTAPGAAAAAAAAPDDTLPGPVPANELPASNVPRYPSPISLQSLDEPAAPLPRTKEQERQDLDAASRTVDLASAQASSSGTLDDYFPRIKNRFRLATLGYDGDFETGFKVLGSINPEFRKTLAGEPLQGSGVDPENDPAHQTEVKFWSATLAGTAVGIEMQASPLGPDHPLGSEPRGQTGLMDRLGSEYIRGHLLNEHLGGPGEPRNLFPITRSANALHSSRIEETIKRWVNTDRYWVRYHVKIAGSNRIETDHGQDYINSTIQAQAWVLDTNLAPWRKIETDITSHYSLQSTATREDENATSVAGVAGHRARAEDLAINVAVSGSGLTAFPNHVKEDLGKMLKPGTTWAEVREKLDRATGVGPDTARVLQEAYGQSLSRNDEQVLLATATDKRLLTIAVDHWAAIMAQLE
ncbi:hypothetical protein [Paeniglutamicibacter psychrophenolicus]|uniref:Carbon monoxide dehydrogenase subunit G n=1 Tax=Paeniglutamicibacter psychrophenolicus TaxID=257454 RepID=A0ABS4WI19_9MICC|nr:hypothetical protein [Paeniglutamicibacter psychrophenolicus]MBP2375174.1 carbon monoxide dehydrogenase subunit G [Paeniglutamicibacter psychrophenolicus]